MNISIIICLLLTLVSGRRLSYRTSFDGFEEKKDEEKNWVVLVAGSNSFDNYRHQADVCHAYHVVRSKGVPADHIIVMMYDDIANNSMNPHKGKIFNHPHGPDVYQGVPIDYRSFDVNSENFLAVLRGDEERMRGVGSGRVVKSTSSDHIFLNMVDHGAPGIFCFPEDNLYARDMLKTIELMHDQHKYSQMVIYMESCESGSMFDGLLASNISVYATTAADPGESSYACYWDDTISTYLGDVYSVVWMDDSEKEDSTLETLHKQFLVVKKDTNTSHVTQYGDVKMARESVEDFQGPPPSSSLRTSSSRPAYKPLPFAPLDAVPSEDVSLAILYRRLDTVPTSSVQAAELKRKVKKLIKERGDVESVMGEIVGAVTSRTNLHPRQLTTTTTPLTSHQCYKTLTKAFDQACFSISQNAYARKKLRVLLNMCESGVGVEVAVAVVKRVCGGRRGGKMVGGVW